jgi:hypothetical protein
MGSPQPFAQFTSKVVSSPTSAAMRPHRRTPQTGTVHILFIFVPRVTSRTDPKPFSFYYFLVKAHSFDLFAELEIGVTTYHYYVKYSVCLCLYSVSQAPCTDPPKAVCAYANMSVVVSVVVLTGYYFM